MSGSDEHSFAVTFTCDAVNEAKMRTDMVVRMIEPDQAEFALATDEGAHHGGAGTAPTPLMLFAGGLTACLMTQVRAFSRRLDVEVGRISLSTRLQWRAPTGAGALRLRAVGVRHRYRNGERRALGRAEALDRRREERLLRRADSDAPQHHRPSADDSGRVAGRVINRSPQLVENFHLEDRRAVAHFGGEGREGG